MKDQQLKGTLNDLSAIVNECQQNIQQLQQLQETLSKEVNKADESKDSKFSVLLFYCGCSNHAYYFQLLLLPYVLQQMSH